jgi:hypothetical protein
MQLSVIAAAPTGAARQAPDHTRSGETEVHPQSEPIELRGDELTGLSLAAGERWMPMQVVSPRDRLGQQVRSAEAGQVCPPLGSKIA